MASTLQECIGELIALSYTYRDNTPITIQVGDTKVPLDMIKVESDENNIEIIFQG